MSHLFFCNWTVLYYVKQYIKIRTNRWKLGQNILLIGNLATIFWHFISVFSVPVILVDRNFYFSATISFMLVSETEAGFSICFHHTKGLCEALLTHLFSGSEGSWPASRGPEEVCICELCASNQPWSNVLLFYMGCGFSDVWFFLVWLSHILFSACFILFSMQWLWLAVFILLPFVQSGTFTLLSL